MAHKGRLSIVSLLAVVAMIASGFAGCVHGGVNYPASIVPLPNNLTVGKGNFTFETTAVIYVQSTDSMATRASGLLESLLNAAPGYQVKVEKSETAPAAKNAILLSTVGAPETLGKEGYQLTVTPDGITVKATTAAGLFYGVQTIRQLLPVELEKQGAFTGKKLSIPCVAVEDVPRFGWRGMHLDVSRHFEDVATVKKYIDNLALLKMNVFHWHLTDSQGWRIEIKKYPKLTEVGAWRSGEALRSQVGTKADDGSRYGGFYTQDEVRDVVKYAADRFVTVLPEIEMPGHSGAALIAYPQFLCVNADGSTSRNADVYCAGQEATYTFLENVLTEVMALFPSEYIHIGGDEVNKRGWQACKYCQALIKREKLANEDELQSYFVRRMEKFLVAHGRKLVGWDEILQGGLAPEATVMSWRGMAGGVAAAKLKHDVIMAPENWVYFNHWQGPQNLEPQSWGNGPTAYTPLSEVYSLNPVPKDLTPEEGKYVIGVSGCLWAEFLVNQDLAEYMLLPRLDALAEVAWTVLPRENWEDFKLRMVKQYKRYDVRGANYARSPYIPMIDVKIDTTGTGNAVLKVSNDAAGNDIRYTLNGAEPGPRSALNRGIVTLRKSATFKAAAFIDGKPVSKVVQISFAKSKAFGKRVEIASAPQQQQPARGGRGGGAGGGNTGRLLTNGFQGSLNSADGQWQSLRGTEFTGTIDLGKSMAIKSMSTNFLNQTSRAAIAPTSVEYLVSEDGKNFTSAATVKNTAKITGADPVIVPFSGNLKNTKARYVRVIAHGNTEVDRATMYLDEIVVE
jgi:hexosaminidase